MELRPYESGDCPALARLFYDTVHTVNAKDYGPEQLDAWADGQADLSAWDASFLAHPTLVAEVFGTAILGGLCAYPMAILFMGANAAQVAFYAYIIPFLVSTAGGAILSGVILFSLDKAGALKGMQHKISA